MILIIVLAMHFVLLVKRNEITPNRWPVFQPPLPIGPPDNFLNKFLRLVKAVPLQDSSCHMLFRHGAMADPGREPGNIRPVRRTEVIVPL